MTCGCGCGAVTGRSERSNARCGIAIGQHARFLPGHNRPWVRGYKSVKVGHRTVPLHKVVAEQALGHSLPRGANVHHVDGNIRNNSHGNLVICENLSYHKLLHARTIVVKAGGNPDTQRICISCRTVKFFDEFYLSAACKSSGRTNICRKCALQRYHETKARRVRIADKES